MRAGRIDLDDLSRPQLPAVAQYPADRTGPASDSYTDQVPAGHPGAVAGAQPQPGIRHRLYPRRLHCPTHNRAFAPSAQRRPAGRTRCAGRSKRLFNDRTGIRCGSHRGRCCYRPIPVTPAS
ncbi:hypothetical protein ACPA9J_28125 [Pseudomonas aeruginosa]